MARNIRLTGFAFALVAAALFGSLVSQTFGTAEAQVATRTTTLGAVQIERDTQDAAREAAREAARNTIVSAGCEFVPDPNVVVPWQLQRASSAYFWVVRDCLTQVEAYAVTCEPVRPGHANEGRSGWLLVTAECEIPTPAPRAPLPQVIECSTRVACEVEVTFRDGAREAATRTMKITFDE